MKLKPILLLLSLCSLTLSTLLYSQTRQADLAARARGVLAQTSGTINVAGLQQPVRVLRDAWGVAHIYAETQDDLFFAQGFVAAQDRLWQMDVWRRTGEGKLAELLGESALERDRLARLLRYRGDLKTEYESYAPDAKPIIEAFVRGVNAYITANRARLPIEFQLTNSQPDLWTPEVCLTRMAGFVMMRNVQTELVRSRLARELGTKFVDDFIENDPPRKLELPDGLDLNDLAEVELQLLSTISDANAAVSFNRPDNKNDGSNNWVVDGTMSATGKPLLANDPHRAIALPSLRYLVHLNAPGWNVIGAGEPALPGIAAGHNERVGFGFTIVGIDQQDIYVEETNPANPNEYRFKGRWLPMRVERDSINVKGKAQPVTVELKFTQHGPVLFEDVKRHRAYSLRWVGSEPGTAGYLASLSLNRAQNWPEFLKACERWKIPSENLIYADVDGNIGWVAAGMTPIRKGWSGLMPVPGNAGKYEWQGFLPLRDLPQSYNPAKHYVATANHNILPPGYKRELGYEWATPFRYLRIEELLRGENRKFTVADFERLQHDEVSLPARELTRLLREAKGMSDELRPYVEPLTRWDGNVNKDSAAAALYEIWQTKLTAAVFKSHVPEKLWSLVGPRISLVKTIAALKGASTRWFGNDAVRGRDAALFNSLSEAVKDAKEKLGSDPAKWRWGALHTAPFNHPLATDATLRALFNLPAPERGGDANTVMAAGGQNFKHTHGASFREILNVADWDASMVTSVPGQSGQPQSPHYGDLLPLWAEGKYFPLLYSRAKIEAEARQQLLLTPAKSAEGK